MLWWNKLQLKLGGEAARIRAIEQMGASGDPNAAVTLAKESLEETSPDVQRAAAEALGKLADPRGIDTLTMMLKFGKSEVQKAAAEALTKIGDVRAVPPLGEALKDMNAETRAAAVDGLVALGEASVPPLVAALKDLNRAVPKAAAEALQRIGQPAVKPLLETFKDSKLKEVWPLACDVLAKIGSPAVPILSSAIGDASENVRRHAVEALTKIQEPEAAAALAAALQDPSSSVREVAAKALKDVGWKPVDSTQAAQFAVACGDWKKAAAQGAESVPPLVAALKSQGHGWENVAGALARVGQPAVAPLVELLRDKDPQVRFRAAVALGQVGTEPCGQALLSALHDPDIAVREGVVSAFRSMGGDRAVEGLVQALKDEDRLVRSRAAQALGDMGNEHAVEPLLEVARNDDEVRLAAALALAKIAPARAVGTLTDLALQAGCAEEAVAALTNVLAKEAASVTPEELNEVVRLEERRLTESQRGVFVASIDYTVVSKLAVVELKRRGLV